MGPTYIIMPLCGSILQAETCWIFSIAENPRWSNIRTHFTIFVLEEKRKQVGASLEVEFILPAIGIIGIGISIFLRKLLWVRYSFMKIIIGKVKIPNYWLESVSVRIGKG